MEKNNQNTPEKVLEVIELVASYIGDSTNDWVVIKTQLTRRLSPKHKKFFSRRHEITRKHLLNPFEQNVVLKHWESLTGIVPIIPTEKLHPENWISHPSVWYINQINQKKRNNNNG